MLSTHSKFKLQVSAPLLLKLLAQSGNFCGVSGKPSHFIPDTCSTSDGEKCLNHIQTSSSRSGQKFIPRPSEVPLGNVSRQRGRTLAGAAGTHRTGFHYANSLLFHMVVSG
ncbi:hypothetical protein AVEN_108178-2 [Araneus ventricosus]|uniref:Uncharacterized protein n=1 Tax=Araneus ventricosus TaxID=182803 RepID=A0A4Y2QKD7_ARAVE|nr:hypothetical protein AVEN_108178-2 [Araneus ventricosus]